jgi:hypothetical protein
MPDYHRVWRRKHFWRLTYTCHCKVKISTDPPVPLSVFETVFSEDWPEAAWKISAGVKIHIRLLETTRAVENFCRFQIIDESRGFGAAKLFSSGEIVMVVPPLEVVHVDSPTVGARVHFTFGWVSMSEGGLISHAENMPEPAEGWAHVDARVRDHAYEMLACEWDINPVMVENSEAFLLAQYPDEDTCQVARMERAEAKGHYILPRPQIQNEGKWGNIACFCDIFLRRTLDFIYIVLVCSQIGLALTGILLPLVVTPLSLSLADAPPALPPLPASLPAPLPAPLPPAATAAALSAPLPAPLPACCQICASYPGWHLHCWHLCWHFCFCVCGFDGIV